MNVPPYLEKFRQALRELDRNEINELNEKSPDLISYNSFNSFLQPAENGPTASPLESPDASGRYRGTLGGDYRTKVSLRPEGYERNEINEKRVTPRLPYASILAALERRCPDHVEPARWQQAVVDGRAFLARWGEQAHALGWTARDLFGLHTPPANPQSSYSRLSRYDATGLCWLLRGQKVIAMTQATATITTSTGGTLMYRKERKPAYGPLGDSLDDFVP